MDPLSSCKWRRVPGSKELPSADSLALRRERFVKEKNKEAHKPERNEGQAAQIKHRSGGVKADDRIEKAQIRQPRMKQSRIYGGNLGRQPSEIGQLP